MKTITTNNRTLLFVEVPKDADRSQIIAEISEHLIAGGIFIADTKTITEEQAGKIVERFSHATWRNYECLPQYLENIMRCALDSFSSFLRKHSITGRHAIIEVLN